MSHRGHERLELLVMPILGIARKKIGTIIHGLSVTGAAAERESHQLAVFT
jgi:hypothetical protein